MSEDVTPYGARPDAGAQRVAELRELIAALGWSQRKAADELEVDQRTMRYWVAANPAPPISVIYALRYLHQVHWSERRPSDPLTPEDVVEANAQGGHQAVDTLVDNHLRATTEVENHLAQPRREVENYFARFGVTPAQAENALRDLGQRLNKGS